MMEYARSRKENFFHILFESVIFLKGVFGVLQIFVGLFILLVNRAAISEFLLYMAHGELLEDPADPFANDVVHFAENLSAGTETFIGAYFLVYGAIKLFLAVGLLRHKEWSYGMAIVLLSFFISYELYRVLHTHSVFLGALIGIDILTIFLIWQEYKAVWRHRIIPEAHHVVAPR